MEMRWGDLESGDILCFNPEFEPAFVEDLKRRPTFYRTIDKYKDGFFLVENVKKVGTNIRVELKIDSSYSNVYNIIEETGCLPSFKNGPSLFLICGLVK